MRCRESKGFTPRNPAGKFSVASSRIACPDGTCRKRHEVSICGPRGKHLQHDAHGSCRAAKHPQAQQGVFPAPWASKIRLGDGVWKAKSDLCKGVRALTRWMQACMKPSDPTPWGYAHCDQVREARVWPQITLKTNRIISSMLPSTRGGTVGDLSHC
jgi:hypothetical protein